MKYLRIMGRHAGHPEYYLFIVKAESPEEAMREVFRKNPTVAEAYYTGEASPSQIQLSCKRCGGEKPCACGDV